MDKKITKCEWSYDSANDCYLTACGGAFAMEFIDDNFKRCPYCGLLILWEDEQYNV